MSILDDAEYDREKFYLGKVCKRGHDWNGTGQSLRFLLPSLKSKCIECRKVNKHDSYINNREAMLIQQKTYVLNNLEKVRERNKKYRQVNRPHIYQRDKAYRLANPEKVSGYQKKYKRINHEKVRSGESLRRARQRNCNYSDFSSAELKIQLARFDGCCYCGQVKESMHLDHFLPLSLGGSHVLSNLVFACSSCNCSKRDRDPYEWFSSQLFFSQKRWKSILKLLGKTQKTYAQIPLL